MLSLALTSSTTFALPKVTFDARPLGPTATVRQLPAERRVEDTPDFFPPARVQVRFGPQNGQAVRELNVYPMAGLLAQYPGMRDGVRTEIGSLRALLRARPGQPQLLGPLPFLPLIPADQVLNGAMKYVNFPGGHGVRYLVAFSQEVAPVTRAQVFYTFQGMTDDGRYYVSLQYDVSLRELPVQDTTPELKRLNTDLYSGDAARADAAWKTYRTGAQRQLNLLTNDHRLTRLDRFLGTLRIQ